MKKRTALMDDMAQLFVAFIDQHHAIKAVDLDGEALGRMNNFQAIGRLEGVSVFLGIVGAPESAIDVIEDARERYVALLGGADPLEAEKARLDHAVVVARMRTGVARVG